jgi:hypothetical protein
MSETVIELDTRRRANFGNVGRHRRYLATEEPDGTIVLTPAVVVTELEANLLSHAELLNRVVGNRARGLHGRVGRPVRAVSGPETD